MLAAALCGMVGARPALAQDIPPVFILPSPDLPPPPVFPPPDMSPSVPRHLVLENQYFADNVEGLRAYLESIKSTDVQLYRQLSPDVTQLESRLATARGFLAGGIAVGLLSFFGGLVAHKDCGSQAYSPAALDACGQDNMNILLATSMLGMLAMVGGVAGYWSVAPDDQDLLKVVNKHNRVSPKPLRLQVGYDPAQRHAQAGAVLSF